MTIYILENLGIAVCQAQKITKTDTLNIRLEDGYGNLADATVFLNDKEYRIEGSGDVPLEFVSLRIDVRIEYKGEVYPVGRFTTINKNSRTIRIEGRRPYLALAFACEQAVAAHSDLYNKLAELTERVNALEGKKEDV